MNSYKLTSNLFTVVWPVHTLQHFFSGNNMPFSDIWISFDYRMASFMDVCPTSLKDITLLKMDPQLERVVRVHFFSQTNIKFDPLSLLWTSTQSLHFHTWNSWIYSVDKNIKRFSEIENLDLLRIFVLPIPQKARSFPPRKFFLSQLVRKV